MYAPSEEGRYKVYIVDEAHMLTREAWNALLKILEEPPPRVIFVFATTEPQKIQQSAAPILSRCQRFDFRRIGVNDVVGRLRTVLGREGLEAPEDALRIIGRKADGGMRDALSLLDQVLSLTGGEVEADAVRRVLGLVEEERYLEILDILADGRHAEVFSVVEQLLDEGYDLVEFYHGLLDALRTVLRLRLSPGAELDLRDDLRASFAARAERFEPGDLVRMLAAAADMEATGGLRRSANPRVLVEMLLLRLSYLDRTVDLEELLRAMGGAPALRGGAGKPPAGPPSTPSDRPTRRDAEPRGGAPAAAPGAEARRPGTPAEAWSAWLDSGRGVPRGLLAFLRSAAVREDPDGIEIVPPPGPALERLADPKVLDQIRSALARHAGRPVPVRVTAAPEAVQPPPRVGPADVRSDTLKSLYREEPRLEKAVEELDLELME
jgi:DNA polymerase-3 subunit gamma/tau